MRVPCMFYHYHTGGAVAFRLLSNYCNSQTNLSVVDRSFAVSGQGAPARLSGPLSPRHHSWNRQCGGIFGVLLGRSKSNASALLSTGPERHLATSMRRLLSSETADILRPSDWSMAGAKRRRDA